MENNKLYKLLEKKEIRLPSSIAVFPINLEFDYSLENIAKKLSTFEDIKNLSYIIENDCLKTNFEYKNESLSMEFFIQNTDEINFDSLNFGNPVTNEELLNAQNSKFFIESSFYFSQNNLESFHLQIKILQYISSESNILVDFSSLRILSGAWAKFCANSNIAPSPEYLFSIHSVYEDSPEIQYWLHTHGLHRCGSVELEILDIHSNPQEFYNVVNTMAKRFISNGMTKEEEIIKIGNDMDFVWLSWEKGLSKIEKGFFGFLKKSILGGSEDRKDSSHSGPSGIIFACENKRFVSAEIFAEKLKDNPVFFISNSETKRMSLLAKERLNDFKNIFEFYKNDEQWSFLVKLGYLIDDAQDENQKEHLWFEVLSFDEDRVEGVLINKPYWIKRMSVDDRSWHELSYLTDWIIYGDDTNFTPDSIYRFYQNQKGFN